MKRLSVCLILFLLVSPAWAALNKWVDSEGKVHYSDVVPPEAKKATQLKITPPEQDSLQEQNEKSFAEKQLDEKRNQQEKEKEEKKQAHEKEREQIKKQNCESARNNLVNLEKSPVIATYNEQGERTIMDDTAKNQRIEEAKKAITQYCN